METMCPPGYHHSGFLAIFVIMRRANCFHDCIYLWSSSCFCEIWALCVSCITYNHLYVYICIYIYIIYIFIYIYMLSWKQCALPVVTTMTLWKLMRLGTWCMVHTLILLLWDLNTLCVMDHLWPPLIYIYMYIIWLKGIGYDITQLIFFFLTRFLKGFYVSLTHVLSALGLHSLALRPHFKKYKIMPYQHFNHDYCQNYYYHYHPSRYLSVQS